MALQSLWKRQMKRKLCDIFSQVDVLTSGWITAHELVNISHWRQNNSCRLQACYFFLPRSTVGSRRHRLKNTLRTPWWSFFNTSTQITFVLLCRIMSQGVISNSRWGGRYVLTWTFWTKNIWKCILDCQCIITVSKLPCAMWTEQYWKTCNLCVLFQFWHDCYARELSG